MAIAKALPGLNDLGPSVTPASLSRIRFYLQLSPLLIMKGFEKHFRIKSIAR